MSNEPEGRANSIEEHIGSRIRQRRRVLGMSMQQLAELLRTSSQQVRKHERGGSQVKASRLFELSRVPDVPISFFFDDMPDNITANFGGMPGHRDQRDSSADDTLSRREALELIRAYYRIPDPAMRRRVRDLITSMGMGFFVSVAPTPSFNARLERGWVA